MNRNSVHINKNFAFIGIAAALIGALLACNLPGQSAQPEADYPATLTVIAFEQAQAQAAESAATTAPPTDTPLPVEQAAATPTVTNTPLPDVEHQTQPGEPARIRTWVSDLSSEVFAPEHRAIGDNLNINLLERPFTANEMEYQPYLDITKVEMGEDTEWFYAVLHLEGEPPAEVAAYYALELDTDRDGRGDWLISARVPAGADWTTDGVTVWRDSNDDVGGFTPMRAEAPLASIDGYDERVFNAGLGDDPDAAWVRRDPSFPQRVQLAFKHSLIEAAGTFLWGGWSEAAVNEVGWYDYNDHFTLEQAGSPAIGNDHYPLAELYSLDNTCRWTYGFEPTSDYPGLCPRPTPTPTLTNTPNPETPEPPPETCQEPQGGCPRVRRGLTHVYWVQLVWNPDTCLCEEP